MACPEMRSALSALLDEELPPERAATVRAHLAECLRCRRTYTAYQHDQQALARFIQTAPHLAVDTRVHARGRRQRARRRRMIAVTRRTMSLVPVAGLLLLLVLSGLGLRALLTEQRPALPPVQFVLPESSPVDVVWSIGGDGTSLFNRPHWVAVAPDGSIYVAERYGRIQQFTADGTPVRQWGKSGSGPGEFQFVKGDMNMFGLAIDADGQVYISDTHDRIQVFAEDGTFLRQFGTSGSGPGQFKMPGPLAFDQQGRLYVSDSGNSRIQVFNRNGDFLRMWGEPGTGDGQFGGVVALTTVAPDRVYVADVVNGRIQVFDQQGRFLAKWGERNTPEQFADPFDIVADGRGRLYVSDNRSHRIHIFDTDGNYLGHWGEYCATTCPAATFSHPGGIAIDAQGDIYVVEIIGQRLTRFRPRAMALVTPAGTPTSRPATPTPAPVPTAPLLATTSTPTSQ